MDKEDIYLSATHKHTGFTSRVSSVWRELISDANSWAPPQDLLSRRVAHQPLLWVVLVPMTLLPELPVTFDLTWDGHVAYVQINHILLWACSGAVGGERAAGRTRLPLCDGCRGNTDTLGVSRSQSWMRPSRSDGDTKSPEQAGGQSSSLVFVIS